ncbi:MAG: Rpp14/Pop5 family protein [Candidatus Micrarchaeota archaeon]
MLKPTMRSKKRYLLFQLISQASPQERELPQIIFNALLAVLGEHGCSLAKPTFIGYDSQKKLGIFKCSHLELQRVKGALALVSEVNGKPCALRVLRVSGLVGRLKTLLSSKA